MPSFRQVLLFVRLSRPILLLEGLLLYGLGAAIVAHLEEDLDPQLFVLGLGLVSSLQLAGLYLHEYYALTDTEEEQSFQPWLGGRTGALGESGLPRRTALYASVAALTVAATLASVLLGTGAAPLLAWILLIAGFLGAFFHSVPPIRLAESGFGELTNSVVVGALVPGFAFALQTGELHSLLIMSTTPLVALHYAMLLIFELRGYALDVANNTRNIMVRLGWATGMRLHDTAIVLAVVSLGIALFFDLPRQVALGTLIVLPLAMAQIWQLRRIRRGAPPRWQSLTLTAIGLFGLTAYLELAGFLLS